MSEQSPFNQIPDPTERFVGLPSPLDPARGKVDHISARGELQRLGQTFEMLEGATPAEADEILWPRYYEAKREPNRYAGKLGIPIRASLLAAVRSSDRSDQVDMELKAMADEATGQDVNSRAVLGIVLRRQKMLLDSGNTPQETWDLRIEQGRAVSKLLDDLRAAKGGDAGKFQDVRLFLEGVALGAAVPNARYQFADYITRDL